MNHSEAIETNAAESYLLGELIDPQRDAFEEHYFDCRVCAETVRTGATLLASGHEVVKTESSFRRFRPMSWLPASVASSVAAAGAVIAIYQGAIIPKIQALAPVAQMEAFRSGVAIPSGATRAETSDAIHFEGNVPMDLAIDIPSEPSFSKYRVELRDSAGKIVGAIDANAIDVRRDDAIHFLLRPLPAGRYVLATLGVRKDGNRSEVASASLVVQ